MNGRIIKNKVHHDFKHFAQCGECGKLCICQKVWIKEEVIFRDSYILPLDYYFCDKCEKECESVRKFLRSED